MIRRYGSGFRALLMLGDTAMTAVAALVIGNAMFPAEVWATVLRVPYLALVGYVSVWVWLLWTLGVYRLRARWSLASEAYLLLRATLLMGLLTFALLFFLQLPDVSRGFLLTLFAVQYALAVLSRAVLRWFLRLVRRHGANSRHVLILGTGDAGRSFAAKLEEHPELGLQIVGFLGEPANLPDRWPYLGPLDAFDDVVHSNVVDEVAVCLLSDEWHLVDSIAMLCETEGKILRMPVRLPNVRLARGHVEELDGIPVLSMLNAPNAVISLAFKRVIDVVGAAVGLVLLTPLFTILAVAILVTDGRPILFRQERVGLNGRRFQLTKFRTMMRDAHERRAELLAHNEVNGHAFKVTDDPRITSFGAWLRRSSLDELPQLWNVLRGEMSLVGPRPPLPEEVSQYDVWHRRRLSMKPGITGLWQIEGRLEPEFDRWVEKDLEYIDRWSPWLDMLILLRTIPALIRAEGR